MGNELGEGESRAAPPAERSTKAVQSGHSHPPETARFPLGLAIAGGMVAGFFLGAAIGYALGSLMLWWFAGPYCCGLEGLLAPSIGVMVGAVVGLLLGIAIPVDRNRTNRQPLRVGMLLVIWVVCLGLAWLVGKILPLDYEDVGSALLFHLVTLVLPLSLWWFLARRPASGFS